MDQHELFQEAVRNAARLCAVAAMTAPKSGCALHERQPQEHFLRPAAGQHRFQPMRKVGGCLKRRFLDFELPDNCLVILFTLIGYIRER